MILKIIVFMTLIMVIYFIISNVGRQDSGCIAINGRQLRGAYEVLNF